MARRARRGVVLATWRGRARLRRRSGITPEAGLDVFGFKVLQQFLVRQPGNVLRIEPLQLVGIEHGIRFRDALQRKRANQFVVVEHFLIVAGDFVDRFEAGAKPSRVFSWKPGTDPQDIGVDFGDLNPEAIVIMGQGDKARILILSDDGKRPKGADYSGNSFRGVWLQANAPIGGGNGN